MRGNAELRTEAEMRGALEHAIAQRLTHGAWAWMKHEDGCVEDVRAFAPSERLPTLLASWRRYQDVEARDRQGTGSGDGRSVVGGGAADESETLWLSIPDEARAVAVSEAFALIASGLRWVREFREMVLGNARVAEDEVGTALDGMDDHTRGALREFAVELSKRFGWDVNDAERFVLTGAIPSVEPMTAVVERWDVRDEQHPAQVRTMASITLRIEPWVSEKRVAAAYRSLRRDMIGRDAKPVRERESALFRFALHRLNEQGDPPDGWANVARSWNASELVRSKHDKGERWASADCYDFKPAYERVRRRLLREHVRLQGDDDGLPPGAASILQRRVRHRPYLRGLSGQFIWPQAGARAGERG